MVRVVHRSETNTVFPGGLAVIVRVHIDEAGSDDRTAGVYLSLASTLDIADLGDDPG